MNKTIANIDWVIVGIILLLAVFGCFNIYSVDVSANGMLGTSMVHSNCFKQSTWLILAILACAVMNAIDAKIFMYFAYPFYTCTLVLLILAIFLGKSVSGHNAWLQVAGIKLQPAEFSKLSTAVLLAHVISTKAHQPKTISLGVYLLTIILLPMGLIIMQGDFGSSLVFLSFTLVLLVQGYLVSFILFGLYVAGSIMLALLVPQLYLMIGVLCIAIFAISLVSNSWKRMLWVGSFTSMTCLIIYATDRIVNKILKPHQKNRIAAWISPDSDPLGIGWNVNQSKIAIGSGGIWGKGFLKGTQTKYGFVPEQHTDFIFCTIGEEYGWFGSSAIVLLFVLLIYRIVCVAERQKTHFAMVYGYGLAVILLFHFTINIGMTIGLMPVIGIPLPFLSYGGSSLITFFVMVFILVKLDADR